MKLDHDLHVHTYLSACCDQKERQTPSAILSLAEEMGVKTIGFADHLWANPEIAPSGWYRCQDELQVSKRRADLVAVSTNVRVLVGCEAETIAPGRFGMTRQFADQLDFAAVMQSLPHG